MAKNCPERSASSFDHRAKLLFRRHEKELLPFGGHLLRRFERFFGKRLRFLEIENVDAVAFHEDVGFHLRIPTAREMPKVGAGGQAGLLS